MWCLLIILWDQVRVYAIFIARKVLAYPNQLCNAHGSKCDKNIWDYLKTHVNLHLKSCWYLKMNEKKFYFNQNLIRSMLKYVNDVSRNYVLIKSYTQAIKIPGMLLMVCWFFPLTNIEKTTFDIRFILKKIGLFLQFSSSFIAIYMCGGLRQGADKM